MGAERSSHRDRPSHTFARTGILQTEIFYIILRHSYHTEDQVLPPFRNKVDVAYVALHLDCLFEKGITFNAIISIGSKPLSQMHGD